MRYAIMLTSVTLIASSALAQTPGAYGGANGGNPGLYGGGLSPYLNLRSRGNVDRATNYYNFVRPYTGGTYGNTFAPGPITGAPGRGSFFPDQTPIYADEALRQRSGTLDEFGQRRVDMPPAGVGGGFMNTQGYFGGLGAGRPATPPRRR